VTPRKAGKPMKLQPPIIPVIDVVFNLIIFFMLTPSVSGGDGFLTTNLPVTSGPVAGKPTIMEVRLRVKLYDVSASGEYIPGAKNDQCTIFVEEQPIGGDFNALRTTLAGKKAAGLDPKTPILLHPTIGCLHKYVVRAFDAAVEAGFNNIQFAVPYE
jgi:biopolymer transport protein ExbD